MAASSSRQGAAPAPAACGFLPTAAASAGGQRGACPLPGGASNPSHAPADVATRLPVQRAGREPSPGSRPGRTQYRIVGRQPLPGVLPVSPGDMVRAKGKGLSRVKAIVWTTHGWAACLILAGTVPLGQIERREA